MLILGGLFPGRSYASQHEHFGEVFSIDLKPTLRSGSQSRPESDGRHRGDPGSRFSGFRGLGASPG